MNTKTQETRSQKPLLTKAPLCPVCGRFHMPDNWSAQKCAQAQDMKRWLQGMDK